MRAKTIIIIVFLILLALFLISINFFQSPFGPHGGRVKTAGEYNIEMKNVYPNIYTFLLDKDYKPIKNKEILCEIHFILPDNTKINSQLKPFEEDGFIMELGELNFSTCRVFFNVHGKSVSAGFENEKPIAKKNK